MGSWRGDRNAAPVLGFEVGVLEVSEQKPYLMLTRLQQLYGFLSGRTVSQAEIESNFKAGGGPDWLFVPGGHVKFDATTASLIRDWLTTHAADWAPASIKDFSPAKRQLLTDNCGIEIDGNRIVISLDRDKEDSDSTVYIQRRLSPSETSFWNTTIDQIKAQANEKVVGN